MNFVFLTVDAQMKFLLSRNYADCYAYLKSYAPDPHNSNAVAAVSLLVTQLIMQQAINEMAKDDGDPDRSIATESLSLVAKMVNSFFQNDNSPSVKRLSLRFHKLKSIVSTGKVEYDEYYYWFQWGLDMDKANIDGNLTSIINWIAEKVMETKKFIATESPVTEGKLMDGQFDLGLN